MNSDDGRRPFAFERRRPCARARSACWRSVLRTGCRISASISRSSTTTAERVIATTRRAYPSLDIPFPFALAAFRRRRRRSFRRDRRQARQLAGSRRAGARGLRSRHRQRAARCRRRRAMALSRRGERASASAARKGSRSRASTCSRAARFRPIPTDPLRVDAAVLARLDAGAIGAGFQVARGQSAGRPRRPRRAAARARHAGR